MKLLDAIVDKNIDRDNDQDNDCGKVAACIFRLNNHLSAQQEGDKISDQSAVEENNNYSFDKVRNRHDK